MTYAEVKRIRYAARVWLALVSWSLLPGCAPADEAAPADSTPEQSVSAPLVVRNEIIEPISTASCGVAGSGGFRCQVADIADIGPESFVVGYIDAAGNLKYTYRSLALGQEVAPFAAGTAAQWMRANTSRSWNASGCSQNFFVVEVNDPDGGRGVFLDKHVKCGGEWSPMTRIQIASVGVNSRARPAVASKGDASLGDVLVAWSGASGTEGRLLRVRSQAPTGVLTDTFTVGANSSYSTDAIYNQHSNRWIVGAMNTLGVGCGVSNAVLSSDWDELPQPVGGGSCAPLATRSEVHHTFVAYNPLGDGSYVWWYEDASAGPVNPKRAWNYGPNGAKLPGSLSTSGFTKPIASTYSAEMPYVLVQSGSSTSTTALYGMRAVDKTWTMLEEFPFGTSPVSVRSFPSETVVLYLSGRLIVSDQPHSTQLGLVQDLIGTPYLVHTGASNSLYHATNTSSAGGSSWANGALPGFSAAARPRQIAAAMGGDGRQEIFYIGVDDVIGRVRESEVLTKSYQDLGPLAGEIIRARQISAMVNFDGTISLFYTRYSDDVICFRRQDAPGSDTWEAEVPFAGATTKARRFAVGQNPGGILQVVYSRLADDALFSTWQTSASSDTWTSPAALPSPNNKGREMLLFRGPSGNLRLIHTLSSSNPSIDGMLMEHRQGALGSWTNPFLLPGALANQLSLDYNRSGRPHLVFVSKVNNAIYQIAAAANGSWSGTAPLDFAVQHKAERVAVKRGGDGRLYVFFVGLDGKVYRTTQMGTSDDRTFYPPSVLPTQSLAQGRPVTQSTTDYGGSPTRAVDGNWNGHWVNGSVTHTGFQYRPSWQVDLGASTPVAAVEVFNRTDCCAERLTNFQILTSDDALNWNIYNVPGQGGYPTRVNVNTPARHVRVELQGTDYLSLAEVLVWAP